MILTKQQRIEYLCEQEIPDYAIVKPGRELSLVALSLGKNPRRIDADDKARIMAAADELRADLSVKTDAEISTIFDDAKAKEWRGKHLTIVEAAQTIADKLFPVDPYDWTPGQRADCADSYQAHLKTFVLRNGVAFISPHDQKPFDLSRLSAVNFPADGLIRAADMHLCLRESDANNGHFPVPPKPVSKAPPPITPLTLTSSRSYSRREMESAADEQLPPTAPALAPNLAVWEGKDLWSVGQFAILLCGAEPENRKTRLSNRSIENALRAIELAVAVESLTVAHLEQDPRDWGTFSAPSTVRYFKPADAIAWANRRRAEFPQFPMFAQVGPDSSANADDREPPTAQALCETLPVVPLKHASAMSKPANEIGPITAPSRETSEDEIKRVYAEHGRRMNEARQAKAALNSGDSIESAVVECLQLNGARYKNQEAFITDMLDKYTEVKAEKTIRRWLAKLPPNSFPATWKKRPKT